MNRDTIYAIKAARAARGWSQADLARRLRCREWHIARLETGREFPARESLLSRTLKTLGIAQPAEPTH